MGIAAVAIPITELYKKPRIRLLSINVWLYFGCLYPFPANILCYCLMAGMGLMKLYGDIEGPTSLDFISTIGADAAGISLFIFLDENKHGTGRWVDSSTGWALLGLFAVVALAYYLPPLVKPEKKREVMNDIEANWTEVAASEKKKKVMNVDHVVVNVAEAPILGSGTKSLPPLVKPEKKKMINEIEAILTEVAASEKKKVMNVDHVVNVAEAPILGSGTKSLLEIV